MFKKNFNQRSQNLIFSNFKKMKKSPHQRSKKNLCTTVAIRFYFDFNLINGKAEVSFRSHEVIEHKIEKPTENVKPSKEVVFYNDVEYLTSLKPLEWKKQDHYRVLSISNMRYDAPEEAIRSGYRSMALKHHPDKRPSTGKQIKPDEDYFMCITMAYETLSNPIKRKAYDSIDPKFNNSLPTINDIKNDFYNTLDYYFQLNSRWSEKKPVPEFGDADTLRDDVDKFYKFWYNFVSWREYSYEDEDYKSQCSDRYERRECEKVNKAERQRKKKEEMIRIRNLVNMAYNNDPRIVKFKHEDKEKKFAEKAARQAVAQAKKEEEEKLLREMKAAKEQLEAEEREQLEVKRNEREAQKKALRRQRKMFIDTCKANNYFTQDENEILANVEAVDRVCQQFSVLQLKDLNIKLQSNGPETFLEFVKNCKE